MDLLTAEEVAPSGMCAVRGGLGYVVLCNFLSGSECRLRPARKIGEVTRDSSLLPKFRIALAEACRTGTVDWWCLGARERRGKHIQHSFFRLRLRTRNDTRQGQCGRANSIGLAVTVLPIALARRAVARWGEGQS